MSEPMSSYQFQRPNPQKPHVYKLNPSGMWWVAVRDKDDQYLCGCFFTHAAALAKAYEYAALNAEASK